MMNENLLNSSYTAVSYKTAKIQTSKPSAFHMAGRSVSIHFGNRKKNLPPIYFQIGIEPIPTNIRNLRKSNPISGFSRATFKGGRLISQLPGSLVLETNLMTTSEKLAYEQAFNADIVNLLAGFIAEAKFIALSDNEVISPRLVNVNSLQHYGEDVDLQELWEYFKCFGDYDSDKETKLIGLYLAAFEFVNVPSHWKAICEVSNYIERSEKMLLECTEIFDIFDQSIKRELILN